MEPNDELLNDDVTAELDSLESDEPILPFDPGDKVRFKSSVGFKLKLLVTAIHEEMDGDFTVTGLCLCADSVFREYHISATLLEVDE